MMAHPTISRFRLAALILGCVGLVLAGSAVQASAQASFVQAETPSAALARNMRLLAIASNNFEALIGAGKAALALGDTQAAIGFFGRADEVSPASALPQAGMGAAMVADGDAQAALPYFTRAQQLGANRAMIGVDRGLAYDLLGRHSDAQGDYRAAMFGADADEARRRLALSLAITGNKKAALDMLAPLMAKGDAAGARCRALVLALTGDPEGARRSLDAAMPGSAAAMAPFFAKLPGLRSDQKAAAVNLGIFPQSGQSYAAVPLPPQPAYSAPSRTVAQPSPRRSNSPQPVTGDRLASIEQLLRAPTGASSPPATDAPAVRLANIVPQTQQHATSSLTTSASPQKPRVWVQLASGKNAAALPEQFRRMKTRYRDLLEGINGFVAEAPDRSRLLIGPFSTVKDADTFVESLESFSVDAFSWTNPAGQAIRKLSTE